jgi:hypothetical protein
MQRNAAILDARRADRKDGMSPVVGALPVWPHPPACKPAVEKVVRELGDFSSDGSDGMNWLTAAQCA